MTADLVLHWYDFICPFCYVGQSRNALFTGAGFEVIELPLQAHPDIPSGGVAAGARQGPVFRMIDDEARAAGLELNWPPRIPNSRAALAAAEWVRRHQPEVFSDVQRGLFAAHFAHGLDIADPAVINGVAARSGADCAALDAAYADGRADEAVARSEHEAHQVGVRGTPAWLVGSELIVGLRPEDEFERVIQRRS